MAAVASSDDLAWMDVKRTIRSFPGVMRATPEAMARSAAAIRDLPLAAEIGFDLAQVRAAVTCGLDLPGARRNVLGLWSPFAM